MAEDALFAFIPGYPVRSRRPFTPSTRLVTIRIAPTQVRYVVKNIPMEMVVAGTDSASVSLHFSRHLHTIFVIMRASTQVSSTTSSAVAL